MDSYERHKFKPLIFNFQYFRNLESCEDPFRKSLELSDLNEEFRESYTDIISRFYTLFRSIYIYIADYDKLLKQLNSKQFINYTLETALTSSNSRVLLAEGLYQFGLMMLILDLTIPGPVRESIIVSHYRYKGGAGIQNMDEVIKLCGASSLSNRPDKVQKDYPVELFNRHPVDQRVVSAIIDHVKEEDIYQQTKAYPSIEHKGVAFANQAAILYVLLFFVPSILQDNSEMMRDIANKHFADNWVISYFQGFTVDLFEAWKNFPAAFQALNRVITIDRVKEISLKQKTDMATLNGKLTTQVMESYLQKDYVLENSNELVNLIRSANVTMRWLMLHRNTKNSKFREIIHAMLNLKDILELILHTSDFECQLQVVQKELLATRQQIFDSEKQKCAEYMTECAEFFAGNRMLGKVIKSDEYSKYFRDMVNSIQQLTCKPSKTPTTIQGFTNSLNSISSYPMLNSNMQIKFYLTETINCLKGMAKVATLRKDSLNRLALIGDFSYAWNLLDEYISLMHENIRHDTKAVHFFRSCFIKLASILNQPLRRIIEIGNEEMMMNVSQYYSNQLVQFVGKVLAIIPTSIFGLHGEMIKILSPTLKAEEAKITKEDLLSYAHFDERFKLAKHAHRISLFAEGMLSMDKCLMGVIEVDPKEFLVNGIKNEMVKVVAETLHRSLIFKKDITTDVFEATIKQLSIKLDNMRSAMEYVQDLVGIDALSIWREQMSRIIQFNVNREAPVFLPVAIQRIKYP